MHKEAVSENKSKQLYVADWHYGHANILHFDNRPFTSLIEMNKDLVERWNRAVGEDDTVYILGDMFWCRDQEASAVMQDLSGRKVLVRGNHDRVKQPEFRGMFESIADYLEVEDGGRHVALCHYPIPCFKNHFYGWYHLYGHVHSSYEWNMMEHTKHLMRELYDKPCEMYNVGVMMPWMDYTPRTLDEILKGAQKCYNLKKEDNIWT